MNNSKQILWLILLGIVFYTPVFAFQYEELDTVSQAYDSLDYEPLATYDTLEATIDKRTFTKDFKESYTGSSFDYSEKEKPKKEKVEEKSFRFNESFVEAFLFIFKMLLYVALLVAALLIVSALIGKKGVWFLVKKSDAKILKYVDIQDTSDTSDIESIIAQAEKEGNFRDAVRYHYIAIIQKMAQKDIIEVHKDKTNSDYTYEIKSAVLRKAFSYVSYIYDYTWYGETVLSETDYQMAKNAFLDTRNLIS